jgi:hypothetical protein
MKLYNKHETVRSAKASGNPAKTYHNRCGRDGNPFQVSPDLQRLKGVQIDHDAAEMGGDVPT